MKRFYLCLLLTAFVSSAFAAPVKTSLTKLQFSSVDHHSRAVFTFSRPFNFVYFSLKNPNRLVFDFKDAAQTLPKAIFSHRGRLIKKVKAQSKGNNLRVTFYLNQPLRVQTIKNKKHQLMADLFLVNKKKNQPYISAAQFDQAIKPTLAVVVLDPGHGGKDPGATGPDGIHEKNVVLAIGLDVRALLRHYAAIQVDMTRDGDYFVTLTGRLQVARRDHANVFMSIHADAFYNKQAKGATVFTLTEHGATNAAARWIAKSENYAVLAGSKYHASRSLKSVLVSLSLAAKIKESLLFGADVIKQLRKVTVMHSYRVDQAPFVVLKSPEIPALLVETGFISNEREERMLNTASYQHKLARALASGIVRYLYQYPPRNTVVQWQQSGRLNIAVKKGETLDSVARAYDVSVKRLRHANHLKTNQLKIGERLKIPPVALSL